MGRAWSASASAYAKRFGGTLPKPKGEGRSAAKSRASTSKDFLVMPEGDTLLKLARVMAPRLEGARLERVTLRRQEAPELAGLHVRSVSARGKHLLLRLASKPSPKEPDEDDEDDELYLRTHLGLHGSWHQYPRDARWKKPAWQASVVLETSERTFVCFNASAVDRIPSKRRKLHRELGRLGPDLVAPPVDLDEVLRRLSRRSGSELIANLLLDQTLASGIGNVFKSEVLFLARHRPDTPLARLSGDERRDIYRVAAEELQANAGRALRTTTGARGPGGSSPRLWVYGRAGRGCLRCSTAIRFGRMGRQARSTYWCPRCQTLSER